MRTSEARSDPSSDVREKAVFWLSQVPGSTGLLEEILKGNADENIKEKALFALSQQRAVTVPLLKTMLAEEGP